MNIVMMTNAYLPHVGGVAQSVDRFSRTYRALGHRVLVVAPEFEGQPEHEQDVIRMPAIQRFNGSDFAVTLPALGRLKPALDAFEPDIIHSHHPFLIGDTAIRVAASRQLPLVFTHHTMYEQYVHYVPLDAPRLQEFAIAMVTAYANQSDHVLAPSASVARILRERGIETTISVVPTGVEVQRFRAGDGAGFRQAHKIPLDAFVIGHVGRLAPEKNLHFLARAAARACARLDNAYFLVIGSGPSAQGVQHYFETKSLADRLVMAGVQKDQTLVDAYHAMDVFAFSSHSETQGMVLIEAMAAGVPVVALDASGVREVVQDHRNGRLLSHEDPDAYARALQWVHDLPEDKLAKLVAGARMTGDAFSAENCARRALEVYQSVLELHQTYTDFDESAWGLLLNTLHEEWLLWSERVSIATEVIFRDFTLLPEEEPAHEAHAPVRIVLMACPHCSRRLKIPRRHVGSSGKCNHCGGRILVDPARVEDAPQPESARSPVPDQTTFPYDFDEGSLWIWMDKEVKRGVRLQDFLDFLAARLAEFRPDTFGFRHLERMRHQLREAMLYRNWKARQLERRGATDQAMQLYEENLHDLFTGHLPYNRLRILYARRRDYDNAIRVCHQFLNVSKDPVQREKFSHQLQKLQEKRARKGRPAKRAPQPVSTGRGP
jgi:1,2-diacylglycerol 3-alpha-glucosyltransferase